MYLTINYYNSPKQGRIYYPSVYCAGVAPSNSFQGDRGRLYFNGSNESECLDTAYKYLNDMPVGFSRAKLRICLDSIKR